MPRAASRPLSAATCWWREPIAIVIAGGMVMGGSLGIR